MRDLFKYENESIKKSRITDDFKISIVGKIKKISDSIINPNAEFKLSTPDKVLIVGRCGYIMRFKAILPFRFYILHK